MKIPQTNKPSSNIEKFNIAWYDFKDPDIISYFGAMKMNATNYTENRANRLGRFFAKKNVMAAESQEQLYSDIQTIAQFSSMSVCPRQGPMPKRAHFIVNKDALNAVDPGILERFDKSAKEVAFRSFEESISAKATEILGVAIRFDG